ncbi:hypothetical protein [Streptomyces sp. A1499]|uniref:hypothetical protein n=1 Tax=Streptomyces sp. A1499 TaxID=2563104 RepID=UPI000ADF7C13|nr:hypothetical protein [Streptomyces sp. A1499]THC53380.1 hypothetical protein E7X58_09120 [Streptomyces sp. A1499]
MKRFLPRSRRRRQAVAGAGVALAAVAGFAVYSTASDEKTRLVVSFTLGGGSHVGGTGDDLEIEGTFRGLAVSADDTVHLFTQEDDGSDSRMVMWRKTKSGAAERVPVSGMDEVRAEQAAVAADGSVYLAGGEDGLWKVGQDGEATHLIATRPCEKANPVSTPTDTFCTDRVSGVTISVDGTVYIGDGLVGPRARSSYVHRLDGETVGLVAGRPPKARESGEPGNSAVRHGFDPPTGTKATDVLVPDPLNAGALAAGKRGIYWKTGPGIVRINADGTLSPAVAAREPAEVDKAQAPFSAVGRALDAAVPRSALDHPGGLSATTDRDEIFYSDTSDRGATPTLEGDFRWQGVTSDSQEKLLESAEPGGVVYRVADGRLAPVIAGVQSIATSENGLYVAVQTDGGDSGDPKDRDTAVLRVRLPG